MIHIVFLIVFLYAPLLIALCVGNTLLFLLFLLNRTWAWQLSFLKYFKQHIVLFIEKKKKLNCT